MRIIAYDTQIENRKLVILESTGDKLITNVMGDALAFLVEQYNGEVIRVCWNLDATVAPLLKGLGEARCIKLHQTHRCYYAPFNIFYIPSKIFSVEHIPTHCKANFYDLAQYYPELKKPVSVVEIQMLGEKLMYELKKMGLKPTKLTSPVAIYEQCVMSKLDLPKVSNMPKEAAEFAYRCSGRLWIEAYQLGYNELAYDYDIIASFPSVARDLVDIRYCDWVKSNEYQASAVYGYVKCEVTIYDWVGVSPIIKEEEDGSLITPIGTWETYLTKGELDFIDKRKIGEYKILEGWWAMPLEITRYPLIHVMDKLLTYKEQTGLQAALAKRMSVGIYGKFGEERQDAFGPYFNPCWFAEISTQVRLKVAEWIYENKLQGNLLHVSVDGVLLDTRVKGFKPVKIPKSKNGVWKLNSITSALIVSSGLVFHADKKPKGLSLDDVLEMIKEHPRTGYYEKRIVRRVTLADALAQGKFEDLGKEVGMVSSIDLIRLNPEREFKKLPKSGEQLLNNHYKSKPRRIE